jgi:hypothetical protein
MPNRTSKRRTDGRAGACAEAGLIRRKQQSPEFIRHVFFTLIYLP